MKKILPLLMLIGVVIFSGCVGQTTTKPQPGTNGVIITDFSSDANTIMADDSINLNLEVQNVGGAKASDINVSLYGVTFGSGDWDWDITSGSPYAAQSFELTSELLPPEGSAAGDFASNVWTLKAPKGIKSDTIATFDVRVDYDYLTDVTGTLTFVSKDFWNSLSKTEKDGLTEKAGVSQLTQTGGPISISLYAGQRTRPFVADASQTTHTMRVIINNVGSGEPSGNIKLVASNSSSGISISCPVDMTSKGIKLSQGKTASFSCTLTLDKPENILNKQDFTIYLGFIYGWRVDSSTEVTVQKTLT